MDGGAGGSASEVNAGTHIFPRISRITHSTLQVSNTLKSISTQCTLVLYNNIRQYSLFLLLFPLAPCLLLGPKIQNRHTNKISMCMKYELRITSTNDEGWLKTEYDGKLWEQIMGHKKE